LTIAVNTAADPEGFQGTDRHPVYV